MPAPVLVKPEDQIDAQGERIAGIQITAANAVTYGASGLPEGLSCNEETGKIIGTPTVEGSKTVTVKAVGSGGEATTTFKWTIGGDVVAEPKGDQHSRKGQAVSLSFATPNAAEYEALGLPEGLTIDSGTGLVTGTPTVFGSSEVTIKAKSASSSGPTGTLGVTWGSRKGACGGYRSEGGGIVVPEQIQGIKGITQIDTGAHQMFFLRHDGSLWSGGENSFGELGNGTQAQQVEPIEVPLLENKVLAVSVSGENAVCLMEDKTLKTWGNNGGQLSIGSHGNANAYFRPVTPEAKSGEALGKVTMVTAGHTNTVIVKEDGTLWRAGQKDEQSIFDYFKHEEAFDGLEIEAIACSFENTIVLLKDGTVRIKGRNTAGQLGNGNTQAQEREEGKTVAEIVAQLVEPKLPEKVVAVALSEVSVYCLGESGRVICWGDNASAQLGNGKIGEKVLEPEYGPAQTFVAISPGGPLGASGAVGVRYCLGLKSNGQVWAWGANNEGECGDGTTGTKVSPVRVQGISNATQISAGESHAMALVPNTPSEPRSFKLNAGAKSVSVKWRNPAGNKPSKFEVKYRREQNEPGNGSEPFKTAVSVAPKGTSEEEYELTGLPIAELWPNARQRLEIRVAAKYSHAKPTALVSETGPKQYLATWTPSGEEPGWFVKYRRTETYKIGAGAAKKEPFNENGEIELPYSPGSFAFELPNFVTGGTPAELTGKALEFEVEGSYAERYGTRFGFVLPGGEGTEVPRPIEPAWLTAGVAKVGATISIIKASEWTQNPTSITKQWYRRGFTEATPYEAIGGATGATYVLQAADVGKKVHLFELAKNAVGDSSEEAVSGPTWPVIA